MSNYPIKFDIPYMVRECLLESLSLVKDYKSLLTKNEVEENNDDMEVKLFNIDVQAAKFIVTESKACIDNEFEKENFINFVKVCKHFNLNTNVSDDAYINLIDLADNIHNPTQHPYKNQIDILVDTLMYDVHLFIKKEFGVLNYCFYKVDYSNSRRSSWGGVRGINIALRHYIPKVYDIRHDTVPLVFTFNEYRSLRLKKDIGNFRTSDWRLTLLAVFCHEVAHFVQYSLFIQDSHKYARMDKPHGVGFQEVYATLRNRFVNPYIEKEKRSIPYTL